VLLLASCCNSTSSLFDGFRCFLVDDRLLEDDDEEEDDDDDLLDEEEDLVFFEICRINSAALFSPFFFDFDLDFLGFFLRCDPDRLLELERPRDDDEDDDELEEDDVDLLLLLEVLFSGSLGLFCPFLDLDSPPLSLLLLLLSPDELLLLLDPLLLLLLRLLFGISARCGPESI